MPALSLSPRPVDDDLRESLDEAREALAYWEGRVRHLPWRAVRRRREARELVVRWEARVAAQERERHGHGIVGALVLLATERRLPQAGRRAGLRVIRRARRTLAAVAVTAVALTAAAVAMVVGVAVQFVQSVA
jgi:phage baseplate assembly protein W